ncbi:MAG: hypothetical protein JST19_06200 [Bacteroidetes bacterium]|nr:hypothetical protein [Bacteroidota bacterium]
MKRILTIVCCLGLLLSFSSCTKQYITPNNTATVYATLAPSDWTLYSDGKSYDAPINVNDIDPNFAQTGNVIVSISFSDGVWEQVPETYNNVAYSFTYNQGNVTLYAQSADGTTPVQPTDNIKVKITLIATN